MLFRHPFRDCAVQSFSGLQSVTDMDLSSHLCEQAGLSKRMLEPRLHSMLVNSHTAQIIGPHRAAQYAHDNLHARLPWIWSKYCNRVSVFRPSRLRAHQTQGSLGPDESQSFSNTQVSDEETYRQLSEEFPTDLADDTDPEGKELTLEDLVTAQGSIPASLRNELHSGDVWGPPVSPPPSPLLAGCCASGNRDGYTSELLLLECTLPSPRGAAAFSARDCV